MNPERLPGSWAWATLAELGVWRGGGTPSKSNAAYWDEGDIPWVSPKDMKRLFIADSEDHVTATAIEETTVKLVPAGSIAFVVRSGILDHTLPIALIETESAVNQDMRVLVPSKRLNARWLLYALLAHADEIRRATRKDGVTVASIDSEKLEQWRIPVSPRPEQDRLADEVDRLFAHIDAGVSEVRSVSLDIAAAKATVLAAAVSGSLASDADVALDADEGADELAALLARRKQRWEETQTKTTYPEPLQPAAVDGLELPNGWTWATVDQLSRRVQYGSSAKTNDDVEGVPVLRMGNLFEGSLKLDELKFLPSDHDEFPELLLEDGDLLFNRTNSPELVGKTAVWRGQLDQASFASYLIRVQFEEGILPEFISIFMTSTYGKRWIRSVVSQQVGQANVNGTKLRAATVPFPPLRIQRTLVEAAISAVETVEIASTECRRALELAAPLKRAVLIRGAEGLLTSREEADGSAADLLEQVRADLSTAAGMKNKKLAKKSRGVTGAM